MSLSTSREFEVAEQRTVLPTRFLETGDVGWITYVGATAVLRSITLIAREPEAGAASDPVSWVRVAIAEQGSGAPIDTLERAAVTLMAESPHVTDRRALARAIGTTCARLDRHRRAANAPGSHRTP